MPEGRSRFEGEDGRGAMIRRLEPADHGAVVTLVDASVGEGFLDASLLASGFCFVAEAEGAPAGVLVAAVRDAAYAVSLPPALRDALAHLSVPAGRLLHIAELAVDP